MHCLIHPATQLPEHAAEWLRDRLTKPGSDFQRKLGAWLRGLKPEEADGHIAIASDHGEIVGWCRTETWGERTSPVFLDQGGPPYCWEMTYHDTLEAFVAPEYRGRGIAAWCASGLASALLTGKGANVAVFHPHMLLVARRACLHPTLFQKKGYEWARA
jgi:GNAT superfamily N-acetyltransferase